MASVQEVVVLQGHIIDSLILAKVLDTVLMMGGTFDLQEVHIGKTREESSRARILVRAETPALLQQILQRIQPHGASVEREADCRVEPSPADGIFPEDFYASTHLPTQIRLRGKWVDVSGTEMDLGVIVDVNAGTAHMVSMGQVRQGQMVVTGREGVRVIPLQRPRDRDVFGFMESQVSAERPHGHVLHDVARRMRSLREGFRKGQPESKVLLAGGPAIIHAGGRAALSWLIEEGFIQVLFCGNALPAHDM
ncbi:MAG TPA: TIGR00300 family protein, partial [Nitrospiraceae bacterium]